MATPLTLNIDRGADGTARVIVAGEIDISYLGFDRAVYDCSRSAVCPRFHLRGNSGMPYVPC